MAGGLLAAGMRKRAFAGTSSYQATVGGFHPAPIRRTSRPDGAVVPRRGWRSPKAGVWVDLGTVKRWVEIVGGWRVSPTPETFQIGGDLEVRRVGFGAMRLCTASTPTERKNALRVLRRAVELGVNLVDTAHAYVRTEVNERQIAEALHPYPDGLVIATKGGLVSSGSRAGLYDGRPETLRSNCEKSLRQLRLERIDLYQLHGPDPAVPIEESVGELARLREVGKVRHVGLSNVSVELLERAREIVPIVSVQNRYSLADRASEDVLEHCDREGIAFLPFFPLAVGRLAEPGGRLARVAREKGATPAQIALAWLLHRSPVMLPIPGTASVEHLEEKRRRVPHRA
jgi:pyridoxine 4-dehydrogenase